MSIIFPVLNNCFYKLVGRSDGPNRKGSDYENNPVIFVTFSDAMHDTACSLLLDKLKSE